MYKNEASVEVVPKPLSFVDVVKGSKTEEVMELVYSPPTILSNGEKVVDLTDELECKNKELYALHLYGYFVGESMSFSDLNVNVRRMWKQYGVVEVTMNREGFYFFKFLNVIGLQNVLSKGPWMVGNFPLFVRKWEPGVALEKLDPSMLPLWIKVHNLPMKLWSVNGIGKLFSRFGKPVMMDKMTRDKCASKIGVVGFARVLVEVPASEDLPDVVKVKYLDRVDQKGVFVAGNILNFKVSYQWKPKRCSHCSVFGHTFEGCNKREVSVEDKADTILKVSSDVNVRNIENVVGDNGVQRRSVFDRLEGNL